MISLYFLGGVAKSRPATPETAGQRNVVGSITSPRKEGVGVNDLADRDSTTSRADCRPVLW